MSHEGEDDLDRRERGRDPLIVEVPTVLIRILKQQRDRRNEQSDRPTSETPVPPA